MQPEERGDEDLVKIVGGVVRRIDVLGRVVVPAEMRKALGIRRGDLIATRLEYGRVVIEKVQPECAVCGDVADLIEMRDKHVCSDCVRGLVANAASDLLDNSGVRGEDQLVRSAIARIR